MQSHTHTHTHTQPHPYPCPWTHSTQHIIRGMIGLNITEFQMQMSCSLIKIEILGSVAICLRLIDLKQNQGFGLYPWWPRFKLLFGGLIRVSTSDLNIDMHHQDMLMFHRSRVFYRGYKVYFSFHLSVSLRRVSVYRGTLWLSLYLRSFHLNYRP